MGSDKNVNHIQFQYLLVRLKGGQFLLSLSNGQISIPLGTIKSKMSSSVEEPTFNFNTSWYD